MDITTSSSPKSKNTNTTEGPVIDTITIASLFGVCLILQSAYIVSRLTLARETPGRLRVLFVWHVFDGLMHFLMEGSFLYNTFFVYAPLAPGDIIPENNFRGFHPSIPNFFTHIAAFLSTISPSFTTISSSLSSALTNFFPFPPISNTTSNFLSATETVQHYSYGARHGTGPTSLLWQEYAKADSRWGNADLSVVSLELLTVVVGGPLALWCAWGIARRRGDAGFWMCVLGVGELYGGFMTFAPEWLSGSGSLDTGNWMYLWLYLVFFNCLWVVFPLMSIFVFYEDMSNAFKMRKAVYAASAKARAETEKIKGKGGKR